MDKLRLIDIIGIQVFGWEDESLNNFDQVKLIGYRFINFGLLGCLYQEYKFGSNYICLD